MKNLLKLLVIALFACTVNVPAHAMKKTPAAVTKKTALAKKGPKQNIFDAAEAGDLARIKEIVDEKTNRVHMKNKNNSTALEIAVAKGHAHIVKYLIEKGAIFKEKSGGNLSPLEAAITFGHVEVVKVLLNNGAYSKLSTEIIESAMIKPEIFKLLINYIPDINQLDSIGNSLLGMAIYKNLPEMVKLLLEKNADIEQETRGRTPLIIAIGENNPEIIEILLHHNADANKICNIVTPLAAAIAGNQKKTIELLLMHNADFNLSIGEATPLELIQSKTIKQEIKEAVCNGALYQAARDGDEEKVTALLNEGNSSFERLDGATPLMIAAEKGHTKIVEKLIEKMSHYASLKSTRISRQASGHFNISALYLAAKHGKKDIVELLLKYKANPNVITTDGWTPLMIAAHEGHTEIAQLLLNAGSHYTLQNSDDYTAHEIATEKGHHDICRLIEERREALTLFEAASMGDSKIEELIAQNPHCINDTCITRIHDAHTEEATPLYLAIKHNHKNAVKLLVENKADVNKVAYIPREVTPLSEAIIQRNHDIVTTLLEYNAHVSPDDFLCAAQDLYDSKKDGSQILLKLIEHTGGINSPNINKKELLEWAIHDAILHENQAESLKLLLKLGVDVHDTSFSYPLAILQRTGKVESKKRAQNIINLLKGAQLFRAAQDGAYDTVVKLCKENADTNYTRLDGVTPLMIAAEMGHTQIVKALITFKANLNAQAAGHFNASALHLAVRSGKKDVVELLLKCKAHANAIADFGLTPLMIAAQHGHTDVVTCLLNNNPDTTLKNNKGRTAYDIALSKEHNDICKLLEAKSIQTRPTNINNNNNK